MKHPLPAQYLGSLPCNGLVSTDFPLSHQRDSCTPLVTSVFSSDWVACRTPEHEPLPGLLKECTSVERLALPVFLRTDRIIQASTVFFEAVSFLDLGRLLTESSQAALEQILRNHSLAQRTIVFVKEINSWTLDSMMARCGIASIDHILLDFHSNTPIIAAATHGGCVSVNISSASSAAILQSCLVPVFLLMIYAAPSSKCPSLISRPQDLLSSRSSTPKHVFRCMKDWSDFFRETHPSSIMVSYINNCIFCIYGAV
jgi:hypothetical protein